MKGTIADGKLVITDSPYLGEAESSEVYLTAMPVNATDWMQLEDIVFNYDSEAKVFSGGAEQFLVINASKVRIYYFTEYLNVNISRLAEQSVEPKAPQIIDFSTYDNSNGYGYFRFDIPLTDIYGNGLLEEKLYYQVLVDDEHVISEYVFSKDKYETLSENLSIIPYSYSDGKYFDLRFNYETRVSDKIVFITENEPFSKNRIGIRSVYYGGGTENASDTVWCFLREFADVLALREAKQKLSEEIDYAKELLNDETKARGKDDFLAVITAIEQILQETTNPSDISIISKAIEDLKEAEEAYISLNLMIDSQEWMALKTYYQSVGEGDGWKKKWDFSSNVPSVATLPGVTAYDGHVTAINLSGNDLSGSFPIMLFALPKLESMNFSNNQLTGDLGMTLAAYVKMNPTIHIAVKDVDISNNQFVGNVGLFANCIPSLVSLNASNNCLEDVYPMIPATVTTLDLSHQTISRVVPLHLAKLSLSDIATKVPSILLYDHTNQTFTPNINLMCTTADNSWGMMMTYQNGQLAVPYVSNQNTYYGETGDTLNVSVYNNNGVPEGSTFRISLSFDEGDGNFDGQVNVLDLQTMINYMFEEYTNKPYNFTASNLWKDNVINVQDAVCMVNRLLDAELNPSQNINNVRKQERTSDTSDTIVFMENGQLVINSNRPIASFDIIIATSTNEKCIVLDAISNTGFTCAIKRNGNQLHLVGYSLSGVVLPPGKTAICNISNGTVLYALLADKEAQEITTMMDDDSTKIQSLSLNAQSKRIVYRIPLGAKRAIIIDAAGNKTMIKDEK